VPVLLKNGVQLIGSKNIFEQHTSHNSDGRLSGKTIYQCGKHKKLHVIKSKNNKLLRQNIGNLLSGTIAMQKTMPYKKSLT
jgi:hypothetical protein